jgi:hypothetical protein
MSFPRGETLFGLNQYPGFTNFVNFMLSKFNDSPFYKANVLEKNNKKRH